MTLPTNHKSSLRPISEDHLRMFRKSAGSGTETDPKINIPKPTVYLSWQQTTSRWVQHLAERSGGRPATVIEALMDMQLLEAMKGKRVFIGWEDAPESAGEYQIDRRRHSLKPITREQMIELPSLEVLLFNDSAINAVKEKRPLLLDVESATRYRGRIGIDANYEVNSDYGLVAFVKVDD